jgi:hypothetical protein
LYQKTVVQALEEQNKGDAAAGEDRGALQPATRKAVNDKDAAIREFIRRDRLLPGANAPNSVYVYWTEEFGEFRTDPPAPGAGPGAMENARFVFWADQEKMFMQSPLAKGEALKGSLQAGWWFVLARDAQASYVFWCDTCKMCHKEGWSLSDSADLAPVTIARPAVHLDHGQGSESVPGVASTPTSDKDVAIMAFIHQDRLAAAATATKTVYVYWTEAAAEFRTDPPPDPPSTDSLARQYLVFWSAKEQRFMQTPWLGSEGVRGGLQKGWWVALSRLDTLDYVYWCAQCKACHKNGWLLQDSTATVPVTTSAAAATGHAAQPDPAGSK